eukprot:766792-Hanusia_phi.AAC.7
MAEEPEVADAGDEEETVCSDWQPAAVSDRSRYRRTQEEARGRMQGGVREQEEIQTGQGEGNLGNLGKVGENLE